MSTALTTAALVERGYLQSLISITPPGAPLAPGSKLQPASLGKAPGRKLANGLWAGYAWRTHVATPQDVNEWIAAGANIGLRSDRYPGLDIDALDPDVARAVEAIALEVLGFAPIRTGRAPKRLLVYRLADDAPPITRMRLHLEKDGVAHLIELLGKGQQYLVAGTHPATGLPYQWDNGGPPNATDLTPITRERVERFFAEVATAYQRHDWVAHREGDGHDRERATVEQAHLVAPSLEKLQAVVDKLPNTNEAYPSRDDYITMGYAIRAAAGDDVEDGFEVFASWCAKHAPDERVSGNSETPRSDYERMHGPYTVGWNWLLDQARRFGHSTAAEDFQPLAVEPAPTPATEQLAPAHKLSIRSFRVVKSQRIEWLLPGRVARQHVTNVNGWPGEGKTSVVIHIVARLSKGEQLPDGTRPPQSLRVLFLSTEDSESVLKLRLQAAGADVSRVFTIPDTDLDRLTLPSHQATWERVLRGMRIDVVVVDPMMSFLDDGLKNIGEQDARKFMRALRQVCEATNAAAICIRHPNKATAAGHSTAVAAASGALAFTASARIELVVGRTPDDEETRALAHVKNNLAAPPPALLYRIVEKQVPLGDDLAAMESVAAIEWRGVDAKVTGDELLARREGREERTKLDEAKAFFANILAAGPLDHTTVRAAAKRHGISSRTLERARPLVAWYAIDGNLRNGGRMIWGLTGQSLADYHAGREGTPEAVEPANLDDVTGGAA